MLLILLRSVRICSNFGKEITCIRGTVASQIVGSSFYNCGAAPSIDFFMSRTETPENILAYWIEIFD